MGIYVCVYLFMRNSTSFQLAVAEWHACCGRRPGWDKFVRHCCGGGIKPTTLGIYKYIVISFIYIYDYIYNWLENDIQMDIYIYIIIYIYYFKRMHNGIYIMYVQYMCIYIYIIVQPTKIRKVKSMTKIVIKWSCSIFLGVTTCICKCMYICTYTVCMHISSWIFT